MVKTEIVIFIYNMYMVLIVSPLDAKSMRFKVVSNESVLDDMILKYLPNHTWVAEKSTMKFFTKKYITELGKLIKIKKPEWFKPSFLDI